MPKLVTVTRTAAGPWRICDCRMRPLVQVAGRHQSQNALRESEGVSRSSSPCIRVLPAAPYGIQQSVAACRLSPGEVGENCDYNHASLGVGCLRDSPGGRVYAAYSNWAAGADWLAVRRCEEAHVGVFLSVCRHLYPWRARCVNKALNDPVPDRYPVLKAPVCVASPNVHLSLALTCGLRRSPWWHTTLDDNFIPDLSLGFDDACELHLGPRDSLNACSTCLCNCEYCRSD